MKQKAVIKVCMHSEKSQSQAMKIVAAASGVDSVAIKGEEKNLIEVTGCGMDLIDITKLLRKKLRLAELVSVCSAVGGGGGSDPPTNASAAPLPKPSQTPLPPPSPPPLPPSPQCQPDFVIEVIDSEYGYPNYYNSCSIL